MFFTPNSIPLKASNEDVAWQGSCHASFKKTFWSEFLLNWKSPILWFFLFFLGLGSTIAHPALGASASYSAVTNFSTSQNTDSTWQYGYYNSPTSTTFIPYAVHASSPPPGTDSWVRGPSDSGTPWVFHNNTGVNPTSWTGTPPIDLLDIGPGSNGEIGVVRWTSPFSGMVAVSGRFQGLDPSGASTDVFLKSSSSSQYLLSSRLWDYGTTVPFSQSVMVKPGDTIDFMVDNSDGYNYHDDIGLSATITQVSYDAVADFSASQNPNGVWAYGYYSISSSNTFVPYAAHASSLPIGIESWASSSAAATPPWVLHNTQNTPQTYYDVVQPHNLLNLHPGQNDEKSVVRWIAPSTGLYKIEGRFEGLATDGTTTDVSIRVGMGTPWTGSLNGYGTQVQFSQLVPNSQIIQVTAGTPVDFVVGYGDNQNYYADSTGLAAKITPQSALPHATVGNGLWGEYYDYSAQSNSNSLPPNDPSSGACSSTNGVLPTFTRVDRQVNFDWGQGSPDSRLQSDYFAVRWTGKVKPLYSENYTFSTTAANGVRLWVNGLKVIDTWAAHPVETDSSAPISLNAGQLYSIQMEFHTDTGVAVAKLGWSSPSQASQIIPQSQLYSNTATSLDVLNVKDPQFAGGAKGDGVTDDTAAFVALTNRVNCLGGGVHVIIPSGTYIVGKQQENVRYTFDSNPNAYRFVGPDILLFKNCSRPVILEGAGVILRHPNGMHYGSFTHDSPAQVYNPSGQCYDDSVAAVTGVMVGGISCSSLSISGLELDGNNTQYIKGGNWGDAYIQLNSYGLLFRGCTNVSVGSVYSHNFGEDGCYIDGSVTETTNPHPHTFANCDFEYNARQGMSWSGGRGLSVANCKFDNTGYAPIFGRNGPGAGLDIEEQNGEVCREGQFTNCEFIHNAQAGMYAESGLGWSGETVNLPTATFQGCTFWNFAYYAIQPGYPTMTFADCKIYGSTLGAYQDSNPSHAPSFSGCQFEDKTHPQFGRSCPGDYNAVVSFDSGGMNGLKFQSCLFTNNQLRRAIYLRKQDANGTNGFSMNNCLAILRSGGDSGAPIYSQAVILQAGTISNTQFIEQAPGPSAGSYIYPNVMGVGQNVVCGPVLKWGQYGSPGVVTPNQ